MDKYELLYDKAIQIARKAHKGQFRHDGKTAYITHPFALADMFETYLDKSIAILHDAVEDGAEQGVDITYIDEQLRGMADDYAVDYIIDGVIAMTKPDGVTYKEYLMALHPQAIKFKIGDMTVNLADSPTDYQKMKYKKGMSILLGRIDEH